MAKKFQVEKLSRAVEDIILPKFDKYIEDRKSDISLQAEIDEIVDKIDDYEMIVNDLVEELGKDYKDSIGFGRYWFKYDSELDTYIYDGNKLCTARGEVFNREGLYINYDTHSKIRTRIEAIITMFEETAFNEILKIVESQIDFNEFITKQ